MKDARDNVAEGSSKPVSLKSLALHLRLSTATISAILNDSPAARSIPQATKDRVFLAAREFNYQPNFLARSLRQKRTFTVAVLLQEVSEGYVSSLIEGIEDRLMQEGYLYFVASHRSQERLVSEYLRLLMQRAVEGLILINTQLRDELPIPVVAISGQKSAKGVTRIAIDNEKGSWLGLEHLVSLGHKDIAFFKGHTESVDTELRWEGICRAAKKLQIPVAPELTVQLHSISGGPEASTPEEGYAYAQELLRNGRRFTALVAFNDVSAIGAISAFRDAGYRVPEDISVIGFDDIKAARFFNPRLTTIRQPLHSMGELAASTLLHRIAKPELMHKEAISVEPELVIRESTYLAPTAGRP